MKKRLLIVVSYVAGESYGLLGPQMAATIMNDHTEYDARVLGVAKEDDKTALKYALDDYFGSQEKVIGFSYLGGRPDLFSLAKELKHQGVTAFLAGPQAGVDFEGETGREVFEHRFQGMADCFDFALQGPAQQIIEVLSRNFNDINHLPGILVRDESGRIIKNRPIPFEETYLSRVNWQTLYRLKNDKFEPVEITSAQVLQQIGCPYAAKEKQIDIDYPEMFRKGDDPLPAVKLKQKGCSFCDVAVDKGFRGAVSDEGVKAQLKCLPDGVDGRKLPFELINESPLPRLNRVFELADTSNIALSQINLTLRADYLLRGIDRLKQALETACQKNIRILLSSIGFESFDDRILKNLNKGVTRQVNLDAIRAIRELKQQYPAYLGYLKEEGANHGFIHPTPWDNADSEYETRRTMSMYQLALDILPPHSTPLIIHHASGLGEWVRQLERKESIRFPRTATTIAWWEQPVSG
jgi:hypothetical protein